jgi:hypothetical protein
MGQNVSKFFEEKIWSYYIYYIIESNLILKKAYEIMKI